ncbi:MAG: tripartite tricarboxylate transporter substrate binding protein [Hyphomicrobiaceae bacterium]|nr:tripartite tricarboxylate transporter substrate binding protein [Hyphomicrobiaceae bacterium]
MFIGILRRQVGVMTTVLFAAFGLCAEAHAQSGPKYPSEAITMIVPYNPGGATDLTARVVADYMNKKWGVAVNVVNKSAGVRVPALLELYGAKPDGYTLLMDGMGSSSQMPVAVPNLPVDIMARTFIAIIADTPSIYVVAPNSPIKNLKDLEAEIKKDPASFTWTSLGGAGSYDHAMRKFMKSIGVNVNNTRPVVVKGGAEGVSLTASGSVKIGFATMSSAGPAIAAKIVRPIAITSARRNASFLDIATVVEQGYPDALQADRYGPSGPPNMPAHVVKQWSDALQEMLKDPEVVQKLERIGLALGFQDAAATRARVVKEVEEIRALYGIK